MDANVQISTTEMHTGGEPLRIVESGYPNILGETILDKRRYCLEHLDKFRKFLMFEPRGHYDMYGVLLVQPDVKGADIGVLFVHNAGYSTMCGHAVIALGRYAVDRKLVPMQKPETTVNIQCPCGLVTAYVNCEDGQQHGRVRFHSVPAFAFALDVQVDVDKYGSVDVDIGYGGAFYALVPAQRFGLSVSNSSTKDLVDVASKITEAVKKSVKICHPESPDLSFLYGTILTDGNDKYEQKPTANICVFADKEVDRCPTGSGVTARLAVQYKRGLIGVNQTRTFSSVIGSEFMGKVIREAKCGQFDGVVAEVAGNAYYSGSCTFTAEAGDSLSAGFLLK